MNIQSFKTNNIPFMSGYKQDDLYRKNLAKGLKSEYGFNASPEALNSIMGAQELSFILKKELKPENFSLGKDFKNIKNGIYRINLHLHTQNSDGTMSMEDLLNQSERYAEYRISKGKKDPFIIGITDHDMLKGAKKAVKMIAQAPDRYKNIKLVLGAEISSYCQYGQKKIPFEAPIYSINPFKTTSPPDKDFAKFTKKITEKNNEWLDKIVHELKEKEKQDNVSLDKIKSNSKYIRDLGSPAFMRETEIALGRVFNRDNVKEIMDRHKSDYGNMQINPGTPSIQQITEIVNNSGNGFVGIAHPGRSFKPESGFETRDIDKLFSEFKKYGIKAVESNYQYISEDGVDNKFSDYIGKVAEKTYLLNTGGLDTHGDNIFSNRKKTEPVQLPEEVKKILFPEK